MLPAALDVDKNGNDYEPRTRPNLSTLNSAESIKKWIPSIKADIDFYLKQSEVPCYPEWKIEEFQTEIEYLQRQYKSFVRKLQKIEPTTTEIPWTERAYKVKKRSLPLDSSSHDIAGPVVTSDPSPLGSNTGKPKAFKRISLPVLEREEPPPSSAQGEQLDLFRLAGQDKPLEFDARQTATARACDEVGGEADARRTATARACDEVGGEADARRTAGVVAKGRPARRLHGNAAAGERGDPSAEIVRRHGDASADDDDVASLARDVRGRSPAWCESGEKATERRNVLGLEYESSDSDE
ncbi:PREDICTED: uncharacterized protein LOC106804943 [Priapulus caudatus]|uniref:Uncharacterized protein LOC106804943 n=1 Tax=Priapulus caudatus TaxID=37621 RepID=A0ABM1DPH5_PRICU|nr:PREDICTED: uncharacterized protein LOC106804943 [Priapulus caudatus]